MKLLRDISYAIIGSHGITDYFLPNYYLYYIFFPLFFLLLPENFIYAIIIIKSIIHFSNDFLFLPPPLPYLFLSSGIIVGYKYRTNHLVLFTVKGYLFFHSVNHIKNDLNDEKKIILLFLGFIFILNNSYLLNTIHELIHDTDSYMSLKKRLFISLLCAHITTRY